MLMFGMETSSEGVAHVPKPLSNVIYRPFQPDADLARLVALLAAVEAVDLEGEDVSTEAVTATSLFSASQNAAEDRTSEREMTRWLLNLSASGSRSHRAHQTVLCAS